MKGGLQILLGLFQILHNILPPNKPKKKEEINNIELFTIKISMT